MPRQGTEHATEASHTDSEGLGNVDPERNTDQKYNSQPFPAFCHVLAAPRQLLIHCVCLRKRGVGAGRQLDCSFAEDRPPHPYPETVSRHSYTDTTSLDGQDDGLA